jgi:cytosine/adenosine deaminase-related metal-dependent hydrolase
VAQPLPDWQGRLLLPAFVNPHFHADKVYFSEWTGEDQGGTVEDGFRKTIPFKRAYTVVIRAWSPRR